RIYRKTTESLRFMYDFCRMIRPEILREAAAHLARKGPRSTWPLHWGALNLQTAEKDWLMHHEAYTAKWPLLMADPEFAPPPAVNAEQASSQATALWRGLWLKSLIPIVEPHALDATGGSGIDSWGLEQAGARVTAVEPDPHLAHLLEWNGRGRGRRVIADSAENQHFAPNTFDWVYVDPSRRSTTGRLPLADLGAPNPQKHLATWRSWGREVVLKLSPMLDAAQVAQWFPDAAELAYVSYRREVKELVVRIPDSKSANPSIFAVAVDEMGQEILRWPTRPAVHPETARSVDAFLYDPDSVLVASGGAPSWAQAHQLLGLHPDSRLFTSNEYRSIPGCRIFAVESTHSRMPTDVAKASVVCRAFPERADSLRARHRIGEDSERFLFATRLAGSTNHVFIVAKRLA
nr:class I SAM-dependent methyltransferase [Cryomorphaceae bacterium]